MKKNGFTGFMSTLIKFILFFRRQQIELHANKKMNIKIYSLTSSLLIIIIRLLDCLKKRVALHKNDEQKR